jgi:hypothetical protein
VERPCAAAGVLKAAVPEELSRMRSTGEECGLGVKGGNVLLCGERRLASCTPYETAGAQDRDHACSLAPR